MENGVFITLLKNITKNYIPLKRIISHANRKINSPNKHNIDTLHGVGGGGHK